MMTISQRVNSLVLLGKQLSDLSSPELSDISEKAATDNPWFTVENIKSSLASIRDQYLTEVALDTLITQYKVDDNIVSKKIGLILAGNIPMVGFHDILCCYLTGHVSIIKYSEKDKILIPFLLHQLAEIDSKSKDYFIAAEKLTGYDAAIATGSNNTATHFRYYFGHVPHIIRQNRNSIAVLSGNETGEQLLALGKDIFSYFGLGCRNVSKIFVPKGYPLRRLFEVFEAYKDIVYHNKYKNNYDYNVALFLLNKENFLHNDMLILKESEQIISRIGSLHYHYYQSMDMLTEWITHHSSEIQCVVSSMNIPGVDTVDFGQAQCPSIDTYADGVDTMQFLLGL